MKSIDLSKMSAEELKKLQKDIDKALDTYETRKRQEAMAAAEAAAKEHGFSLSELAGSKRSGRPVNPPKYRHPENATLTWTGRGRQPAWIKDALDAGTPLEEFAIAS